MTGDEKTFEDLRELTIRVAKNLQRIGCDRGKKILIFIGLIPEIVSITIGAICLGCPLVPMLTESSQAECDYFLNLTKPEFAICHLKFYAMLKKSFTNIKINAKIITIDGQIDDSIPIQSLFESVDNESMFE